MPLKEKPMEFIYGLLRGREEQIFIQYVDDTFITLTRNEDNDDNMVEVLNKFFTISNMKFDQHKTITFGMGFLSSDLVGS